MKKVLSLSLTLWLLFNLTCGLFLSTSLVSFIRVNAQTSPTIVSPGNITYSTSSVYLNFSVTEATSWIGYSLDSATNVTVAENAIITEFSVPLLGLSEGSHNVVVYANDTAGDMDKSNIVYFSIDTIPPTIMITSPENVTYSTDSVDLNFTISETTSWIGYSLDGAENITIPGNTALIDLSDNPHNLIVYANDTALNTGFSEVDFTISTPDTTPPIITIVSPGNITYSTSSVYLNFSVTEATSWIGYSLDGQDNVTVAEDSVLADFSETLIGLSEGSHNVVVYANDTADNMGNSTIFFSVDTTPPTITIISPVEGVTYSNKNVPLEFSYDEEVSWIWYSLDGAENERIYGNFTMPGLSTGSHSVVVYANDTSGNMGSSETINFFVKTEEDTTPPIIGITSPENVSYSADSIDLNFTVNEETSWIGYSLDGQDNVTVAEDSVLADFSETLIGLSEGSHNVVVYANDTAGNMGESNIVGFSVDTTPPAITIIAPENVTYSTSSVDLNFTVNEATDLTGYSLDGEDVVYISGNITLSSLSGGSHNVVVVANDTTGNLGWSDPIYFSIDVTLPSITIILPGNITYSTSSVDLNFTVNESTGWIGYSLDGAGNVTITTNSTLSGLSEGSHNVIVYANDTAGNMGKSNILYFSVDTTPPTITITSPTSSTYTSGAVTLTYTVNEATSWVGYSLDGQNNITITGSTIISGLDNGSHNLVVYANDTAGNMGASSIVQFTIQIPVIDTTPPTITITSPAVSTYSTTEIELRFIIDETVSWRAYSLDGEDNVTIPGNTVLSGLSEGQHSIVVYARDLAGNTGASDAVQFSISLADTTPPTITITSPEETTYEVSDIPLDFSVNEQTSWIGYSLDGEDNVTITGNTVLLGLSEGQHSIVVYAADLAGNTGASVVVEFEISMPVVDITPPIVSIYSPQETIYEVSDITLDISVNEPTSWIGYSLDGENNVTITGDTVLSGLSEGQHSIVVYATDLAGNTGSSATIEFDISIPFVDITPPIVTVKSPEEATYAVSDVTLNFSVSEQTSWIGYTLDGQDNATIAEDSVLADFSETLIGLSEGSHDLVVYARDTTGNVGASSTVYFSIDTTPPTIAATSPENVTYSKNNVDLNFTVNEGASWIGYSLDGEDNVTVTGNIVLSGLSEGQHSIVVYAADLAGNTGSSSVIQFKISVPPTIVIVSPENTMYDTNKISLMFSVDEEPSVKSYSLDGKANITIVDSVVLSDLSEGEHRLVMYAEDIFGNIGVSDVIVFTVVLESEESAEFWVVGVIGLVAAVGFVFSGYIAYDIMRRR